MADFNYTMQVDINPKTARQGDRITISAKMSDIVGEIRTVSVTIPEYGIWEILRSNGDGTYSMNYSIPWEAPSTTYNLRVYATSTDGQRGPASNITFTIL